MGKGMGTGGATGDINGAVGKDRVRKWRQMGDKYGR